MRRISPTRSGLEPPDINTSIFVIRVRRFRIKSPNNSAQLGVRVIKPLNARGFPDRDPPPFESEDSEVLRSESVN
jgi:hypothetical protein